MKSLSIVTLPFFLLGEARPIINHICVRLGPTLLTLPILFAPAWELLLVGKRSELQIFKVDITLIIPKLIDGVRSHAKGA